MTDALFQLVRFQLAAAALTPGPDQQVDDAYVYAWDAGVFPLFHEWARLHQPFAECFTIGHDMMRELMTFLDDRWGKGIAPDFHEIEASFSEREPKIWDRSRLIKALRYTFLSDRFDKTLFDALRGFEQKPFDASGITRKFDRMTDISIQ